MTNILIAHISVGDKPLFPGHALTAPKEILRKYPGMDLIAVGDYHYRFQDNYGARIMLNSGTLVRKTTAEKDQAPGVFIYNTDIVVEKVKLVLLKCEPAEKVFDLSAPEKSSNALLDGFIQALRSNEQVTVSFDDNLSLVMTAKQAGVKVHEYVNSVMLRVRGEHRDAAEIVYGKGEK